MAVITQNDIDRAKLDILTIDDFVESNSLTTTTKDAKVIQTLAGITAGINQSQVAQNTADIAQNANDIQNNANAIAAITAGGVPTTITKVTLNGTYFPPVGLKGLIVEAMGGGGSGDMGITGDYGGGGGGSGGRSIRYILPPFAASYGITIGLGGVAPVSAGAATNGGNTLFGSILRANGGSGAFLNMGGQGASVTSAIGHELYPGFCGGHASWQRNDFTPPLTCVGGEGGGEGGAWAYVSGNDGTNGGGGQGGGLSGAGGTPTAAGDGGKGYIIIREFY